MIIFLLGKEFSSYKGDSQLSYVLAQRVDFEAPYKVREFVVWTRDESTGGNKCYGGHYFNALPDALEYFHSVGRGSILRVCPTCGSSEHYRGCSND